MAQGDVLRIRVWLGRLLNPHVYALQLDDDDEMPDIKFLTRPPKRIRDDWPDGLSVLNEPESFSDVEGDEWDVVPVDKWPDEVCVAMAKRKLVDEGETT